MEEVGKHLRNNTDVVGLLHILEVENRSSVHIYVEHRIDKVVFVDQHLLLPPPGPHLDGPNDDVIIRDGHGIPEVDVSFGDGDCIPNAEGNVGDKDDIHVEGRSQDNIRVAIGAKGTRDKAVREREKKKKKKKIRRRRRRKMLLFPLKMMCIVERKGLLPLNKEVLGLVVRPARLPKGFAREVVGQIKVLLNVTV
jgi:hypothetical protein